MQKTSVRHIELALGDERGGRVETGVVKFGDDWPGLFIRGDNAFYYASMLRSHLKQFPSTSPILQGSLEGLAELLDSTDVRNHGLVVESADTADLKPAAANPHEGSSPSLPTNLTPFQEWLTYMPETEKVIELGQRRIVFVDGIGDFDASVTGFGDAECMVREDNEREWTLDWECIGIIVDGVEHKRIMKDLEQEALNAQPQD